jgi:hypothetical protein
MPLPILIRAAVRLVDVYACRATKAVDHALHERLRDFERLMNRIGETLRSGGQASADMTVTALPRHLHGLLKAVEQAVRPTCAHLQQELARVPELPTMLAELRQLDDEFGGLAVDLKHKSLRVATERIVLEGVDLGPFTIELGWVHLLRDANSHCFLIEALEPRLASSRHDAVPHPHVQHGVLCAGDGAVAIQHALRGGRLADAFCLVRSVLRQYNPASAYVALDMWENGTCEDCGRRTMPDDLCCCAGCGADYCSECIIPCSGCDACFCSGCQECCAFCQEPYCATCLQRCAASGRVCCRGCGRECPNCGNVVATDTLSADSGLCPSCRQSRGLEHGVSADPSPSIVL